MPEISELLNPIPKGWCAVSEEYHIIDDKLAEPLIVGSTRFCKEPDDMLSNNIRFNSALQHIHFPPRMITLDLPYAKRYCWRCAQKAAAQALLEINTSLIASQRPNRSATLRLTYYPQSSFNSLNKETHNHLKQAIKGLPPFAMEKRKDEKEIDRISSDAQLRYYCSELLSRFSCGYTKLSDSFIPLERIIILINKGKLRDIEIERNVIWTGRSPPNRTTTSIMSCKSDTNICSIVQYLAVTMICAMQDEAKLIWNRAKSKDAVGREVDNKVILEGTFRYEISGIMVAQQGADGVEENPRIVLNVEIPEFKIVYSPLMLKGRTQ